MTHTVDVCDRAIRETGAGWKVVISLLSILRGV